LLVSAHGVVAISPPSLAENHCDGQGIANHVPGWQGIDLLILSKAQQRRLAPKKGTPRYCGAAIHSLACCM